MAEALTIGSVEMLEPYESGWPAALTHPSDEWCHFAQRGD